MKSQILKQTSIVGYTDYGAPIVLCELRKDFPGGLQFYCEHCKKMHLHGRGLGHRIAHCIINSPSPFLKTGYFLFMPNYDDQCIQQYDELIAECSR